MNKESFISRLKSVPKQGWILIAIVAVGVFLRSYHFSQWLYFYPDQARDVMIVDDFLSGKSPLPLLGFKAASTYFQLGAMYSYFQIISAKIFGSSPAAVAYPDLLFGVLTIPLLYLYLKRYLSINISLALTGLYSVSYYAIRYSRFAWNVNPIPFFVILFLLALHEFLYKRGKTSWGWIALVGIALGVGVQLHTVLLVSFPVITLLAIVYTMIYDRKVWIKWIAVLFIAFFLNTGQIISEVRTHFLNTKYFFNVLNERSPSEGSGMVNNLVSNVICQSQANVLFLSSLEKNDNCDTLVYFKFDKNAKANQVDYYFKIVSILFGFGMSLVGCFLIIRRILRETDEKKKIFLYLNSIYAVLTFLVILPIITHNGQVRYWLPVIFLPYLFLGLMAEYCCEKFSKKHKLIISIALFALVGMNLVTLFFEAKQHTSKSRSNAQYVVLGELESISSYIKSQSYPQSEAYIFGGQKYLQNFNKPLIYIASKNNFTTIRIRENLSEVPAGKPFFFIAQSPSIPQDSKFDSSPKKYGLNVESVKTFGKIGVYEIQN